MATSSVLNGLGTILLPKGKSTKGGAGLTPTFNPSNDTLTAPAYRDHLTDLYTSRSSSDSRALIATLANQDPDLSGAIHSFLTIAGSVDPYVYAYDASDNIDPTGIAQAQQLIALLTTTQDYSIGFSNKPTLDAINSDMRYMALLRGMIAAELVLDKTYTPSELRQIDPSTIEWHQAQNGVYNPIQKASTSNTTIDLNIPTFFTSNFHQSPLDMYTYSPFVSAINTITSRTLVINELYRIMKIVGYPRVDIQVLENVLTQNAPPALRADVTKMRAHVTTELNSVRAAIASLNSGDAFVHSNAIEAKILNDKNPAAGLQVQGIIDVLQSQNLAALKVMPSVVGRGNNGQVASTEARLFAMSADALNRVVAGIWSKSLTLALRLSGYQGRVEVIFPSVELRPVLELEPQKTMKSSRLKMDLSLGLITDIEYCMEVYGRPPLPGQPQLSGTGFLQQQTTSINADGVTANSDPLGRSLSGEGGNGVAKDNAATAGGGGKSGTKSKTSKLHFENEDGSVFTFNM